MVSDPSIYSKQHSFLLRSRAKHMSIPRLCPRNMSRAVIPSLLCWNLERILCSSGIIHVLAGWNNRSRSGRWRSNFFADQFFFFKNMWICDLAIGPAGFETWTEPTGRSFSCPLTLSLCRHCPVALYVSWAAPLIARVQWDLWTWMDTLSSFVGPSSSHHSRTTHSKATCYFRRMSHNKSKGKSAKGEKNKKKINGSSYPHLCTWSALSLRS